jgi:small subunit ribosomal protein S28e
MDNKEEVVYAIIEKIIGRTGSRGGITQVKVTLVNKGRQLVRNVKGPCKEKDMLALLESEREARRLR